MDDSDPSGWSGWSGWSWWGSRSGSTTSSGPSWVFQPGNVYTLEAQQWQSTEPHSYHVLEGTGGDFIATGSIDAAGYADSNYQVAKHTSTKDCEVTRIGVNSRFGDYSWNNNVNSMNSPPDTIVTQNISYSTYAQMQGNGVVERTDGVKNRRVITVPIAKVNDYAIVNGKPTATASRIAAFFLRRKMTTSCTLEVEYISSHLNVPAGEYQPGDLQFGELSIPVLYK
jgi:hypothetical protein